ncbi:MAG: response regulator transcription factor [Pseudomonadota bacterium]|nr:response regulator transcription factor [Pseudomonadota bacterium]
MVGEAWRGADALELARRCNPDVFLLEPAAGGKDPLDTIRQLIAAHPVTRVVILAVDTGELSAVRMLRAGARGYLPRDCTLAQTLRAIRTVHAGRLYVTPRLQRICTERYLLGRDDLYPEQRLSDREFQVLRLLALGHTSSEIGQRLHIGTKTVDTHRVSVLKKLALRNVADLTRFAIRYGLVRADEGEAC